MKVVLNNVRLAFPNLWTAKQVMGQGDAKFSATYLITPGSENEKRIEAAIEAVAAEKWKTKSATVLKSIRNNPMRFCYRDGDTKSQYAGYAGNMFITASNKQRVPVVDTDRTPLAQEDGRLYAGCYVNAFIDIWADDRYGDGVFATLGPIQFAKDGDAFAGGMVGSIEEFDDVSEGALAGEFS